MKKMCFLWFFMGFVTITSAQDIAPGQQAQGYLDDKNTTVDYATGIFHYKVPLYTLGDGGFSLPVSLDYTAKGVKTEDRPGLIGYNWTLNTGGVVTRTIRGGIADETSFYGYLYYLRQSDAVPLTEDAKRVNRHQRDGESDIFTAVFNGQSVILCSAWMPLTGFAPFLWNGRMCGSNANKTDSIPSTAGR